MASETSAAHDAGPPAGSARAGIVAWALVDLIYSLLVVTGGLYLSLWIVQDLGLHPFWYGFAFAASALLLVLGLPLLGAIIDGRYSGSQVLFALSFILGATCLFLPLLGEIEPAGLRARVGLFTFGFLAFLFQAALIPYTWMLVRLKGMRDLGQVVSASGLAQGAACLGLVAGALAGAVLARGAPDPATARLAAIRAVAILFLAAFVIDFAFLRRWVMAEDEATVKSMSLRGLLGDGLAIARGSAELWRFVVSFFFYANGLITVQLFLPIVMRERFGISDAEAALSLAASFLAAALAAIIAMIGARTGGASVIRRVILASLILWVFVLSALGLLADRAGDFYLLLLAAGALDGVVLSASRMYLIQLAPGGLLLGRSLGFYSVLGRCASILGPLLWGGVMLLGLGSRAGYGVAFSLMALFVAAGLAILARKPPVRPLPS
jgi:MFS-type transporter involved in bile tolerance (Atg22 family)